MKLAGEYRFDLPREEVWEALLDPDILSQCLPGFERLERVGEQDFEGALDLRVGPVQGKFQGSLSLSDLDPPAGYSLLMKGQGPAGFVNGEGTVHLDEGEHSTILRYAMDAQIGGKIAGVGQRLLDSSAKAISEQALSTLGALIKARSGDIGASRGETAVNTPSQAEFAARVAKGVASDLIPPQRRALIVTAFLIAVVVVMVVIFRSCGS